MMANRNNIVSRHEPKLTVGFSILISQYGLFKFAQYKAAEASMEEVDKGTDALLVAHISINREGEPFLL